MLGNVGDEPTVEEQPVGSRKTERSERQMTGSYQIEVAPPIGFIPKQAEHQERCLKCSSTTSRTGDLSGINV